MNPIVSQDRMALYCGELREALRRFCVGQQQLPKVYERFGATVALKWLNDEQAQAEELLAQESGQVAERLWENSTQMNEIAFTLADYVYAQVYRRPRSPAGLVPSLAEVKDALERLRVLTAEAQALEGLRARGAGED
jgi:hypothetical protein